MTTASPTPPGQPDRIRLCHPGDIAPGAMLRVEPDGMDPLLLCNLDGRIVAVDDDCTHAIASLSEGRLEGCTVYCPLHGGSFDVRTGKALTLPCKHPLRTWPLAVEDDGVWLLPA